MSKFGNQESVYSAYATMRKWCENTGCQKCPYDVMSDLTDVPCCLFWVSEHCVSAAPPQPIVNNNTKEADFMSCSLPGKVIKALHDLIDLQTGRRKGESDNEYRWRLADVINNADMVLGEVEEKFNTRRNAKCR